VSTARHGCVKESLLRNEAGVYGVRRSFQRVCNLRSLFLKTGLSNRVIVAYNSRPGDLVVLELLILLFAQVLWSTGAIYFGNLGMLVLEKTRVKACSFSICNLLLRFRNQRGRYSARICLQVLASPINFQMRFCHILKALNLCITRGAYLRSSRSSDANP
jgi:hypothetical protein